MSARDDDDSIYAVFDAIRGERQAAARERRERASQDVVDLWRLAGLIGVLLVRHTDAHYQIKHPSGWLLNVYPGNRRIYHDRQHKPRSPFLKLPEEWDLFDVLEAVARQS